MSTKTATTKGLASLAAIAANPAAEQPAVPAAPAIPARTLPTLPSFKATTIGENITASMEGGILTLKIDTRPETVARAQPSGKEQDGALCLFANSKGWRPLTKALPEIAGWKLSVAVGVPNPAFDKASRERKRLMEQAAKLGLRLA